MEVRIGNGLWTEKPHNNGLANSDLPIMSETFKKSMPYGICRIGVRQPIFLPNRSSATHFCRI